MYIVKSQEAIITCKESKRITEEYTYIGRVYVFSIRWLVTD